MLCIHNTYYKINIIGNTKLIPKIFLNSNFLIGTSHVLSKFLQIHQARQFIFLLFTATSPDPPNNKIHMEEINPNFQKKIKRFTDFT